MLTWLSHTSPRAPVFRLTVFFSPPFTPPAGVLCLYIYHHIPSSTLAYNDTARKIACYYETSEGGGRREGGSSELLNEEGLWKKAEALWGRRGGGEGGEEKWCEMEEEEAVRMRRGALQKGWCHVFRLIAESSKAISKVQATNTQAHIKSLTCPLTAFLSSVCLRLLLNNERLKVTPLSFS